MSEFKIKVSVELDDADARDKLEALGDNQEIKFKIDSSGLEKVENQLKNIKNAFKDAFKLDGSILRDIKKITSALEKFGGSNTSGNKTKTNVSSLVNQYKDLYNTVEKLQKQMSKGGLGEEGLKRTQKQINEITNEMNKLRAKMTDAENANLDLFESKKSLGSLTDLNNYLNKIESQASNLGKQIKEIDTNFLSNTSKNSLNEVSKAIEEIKASAKEDILLEVEVGDALDKLKKAEESIKNIQKESTEGAKEQAKALVEQQKAQEKLIAQQQKAQEKLIAQQQKNSIAGQKAEMTNLVNQYKDFSNVYSKLQKQMNSGKLGEDSIKRTAMQMSELKTNMSQLYDKMDSNAKKQIDIFNTKQMNKGIVDMNSAMNKMEAQATSLLTRLNNIKLDNLGEIDLSKLDKAKSQLEEFIALCKQDIDLDLDIGSMLSDLSKLTNETKNFEKIEDIFDKVESASKNIDLGNFTNEVKDLVNYVDKMDGSFEKAFKGVNNGLKDIQSSTKKGGGLFGSIFGSKEDFLGNFSSFTLAEVAGDFLSDGIRQMASALKDTVVETDAAMTDLRKVYDKNLTGDALKGYLNDVTKVAKGTGKSSVDVIQGTAKAVQSGIKDIDDALVFARQSAMFSNVGDVSQEQADTMLTSIMSAYGGVENSLKPVREQVQGMGKDYNTLTKFMDLANHAGNQYAVSTSDIGTALQASSAALKTNGVTMEESVAMA